MKKARLLVTKKCPRSCDGCCNKQNVFHDNIEVLENLDDILDYDEIIITGGEPLLMPTLIPFHRYIRLTKEFQGKLYLYTTMYDLGVVKDFDIYDGIHYTLHYPASDEDILNLKLLSRDLNYVKKSSGFSARLAIDKRVYDQYDLSNIDFSGWNVIRKMTWLIECPLPSDERLLYYDIENIVILSQGQLCT